MTTRKIGCWLALAAMLVNSAGPVLAQGVVVPAPPPPQPTLWSFLGIPQAFKAVREGGINRSGNRPALEKKPPLMKIADPANLVSENPAIKKAAEIKKEEDLKWQKIKAIKYLTTIGCGCYNRDGSITDALMKAMDDCTEEVRYATVLAITGAAGGEMCANCKMRSCCSEEVSNKLYELAYGRDDEGCFLEPSERVRLAAAEALRVCCPGRGDDFGFTSGPPIGEIPQGGEQPGIAPPLGGERPLDAPPLPPSDRLEPTPAPIVPAPIVPPPALPPPVLRPISEPLPPRTSDYQTYTIPQQVIEQRELPRQELPRELVAQREQPAQSEQPRIQVAAKELPRPEVRIAPIARPEIRVSEGPRVAARPSPIVTPAEAPPRRAERPVTATPIINPTIPAARQPAAEPAPAAKPQPSSRRTANLPTGADDRAVAKADPPPAQLQGSALRIATTPATTQSSPASTSPITAPHWTVGAKTPTVFISKPIEPAKPIQPAKGSESSGQPKSGASAENLAPIVPASAMRRLPAPSDVPAAAPAKETAPTSPARFASQRLPAPLPVAKTRPAQPRELPGDKFGAGLIGQVRPHDGVVVVEFESAASIPAGSIIRAYHDSVKTGRKAVGDLEVVHSQGNAAVAVPHNGSSLAGFSAGDQAIVLR